MSEGSAALRDQEEFRTANWLGPLDRAVGWWQSLSLRGQVIILIFLGMTALQSYLIAADYILVQSEHQIEAERHDAEFIRSSLALVSAIDDHVKNPLARAISHGDQILVVSAQPLVDAEIENTFQDKTTKQLTDDLLRSGLSISSLRAASFNIDKSTEDIGAKLFGFPEGINQSIVSTWQDPPATINLQTLSIQLDGDQNWYNFIFIPPGIEPNLFWPHAGWDALVGFGFTLPLILVVGRVMRPLRRLTVSANRLSRGENVDPIALTGSADVRETVHAFNQMNTRVTLSRDYQDAMLRSLAHDLKTPLVAAQRLIAEDAVERSAPAVNRRIQRALETIDSISAFAHSTRRDGERVTVDLESLLEVLVDEQVEAGEEATIEVKKTPQIRGRRNALSRVFQNLIENAVKYGDIAHVTLDADEHHAIICIDDKGPGLDPSQRNAAFRPFERISTDVPGSGLGLSIVKAIVVEHGGAIALENRSAGGLRAKVTLPLAPMRH